MTASTYLPTVHPGTIVGMPAFVPAAPRAAEAEARANATTLRSAGVELPAAPPVPQFPPEWLTEPAPVSDAFHPDRWSAPPPEGLAPIVPCDEPEEDDVAKVMPSVAPPPEAAPQGLALDEPVELPFGHRRGGDSIRLLFAAGLALLSLSAVVTVALFAL
ncbi:MAG: hypothetical protein H6717_40865 [Polyangiaceae bacterium]|nr:hypothetical protein [Polyangiaceae bacterium]